MSYSITGVRRPPDLSVASASRHTAEGAKELALAFIADGMREVEVRDDRGNLLLSPDLNHAARASDRAAWHRLGA